MNQDSETLTDQREALKLKLPEPDVDANDPWRDDVLKRKEIASRLTNLIQNQSLPFLISIHGEWGTGKTFMLKRWQRDLENQDFKAIYFNAWEDDFCDDPLLSILGQLADHFKEDGLKQLARSAVEVALPLIRENALGVIRSTTGIDLRVSSEGQSKTAFLDAYLEQKTARDDLKSHLTTLSSKVSEIDGQPLIFIIDELDRCRPTFAIELLERVKHIFDVPNMVFVLGINRDELCKSLRSIYGEIDADVYLRRFFDMEFALPEVDAMNFCWHMMEKFGISQFFGELSRKHRVGTHREDVEGYYKFFPELWGNMGLSLRDMDYCVRSIALLGNSVRPGRNSFPWLLGLLISLKLKNPNLYRQFIKHDCLSSQVMDYIDRMMPSRETMTGLLRRGMDIMEGQMYCAEADSPLHVGQGSSALRQLELLESGEGLTHPEYLSERTKESGSEGASNVLEMTRIADRWSIHGNVVGYIAELIDLHQIPGRR